MDKSSFMIPNTFNNCFEPDLLRRQKFCNFLANEFWFLKMRHVRTTLKLEKLGVRNQSQERLDDVVFCLFVLSDINESGHFDVG